MEEGTPQLAKDLRVLVDPDVDEAPEPLVVPEEMRVAAARRLVGRYFAEHAGVAGVTVFVGEWRVGVVTRDSLRTTGGMAGTEPSLVGGGDRIQLPGASSRYRLLTLRCTACAVTHHRVFYELRDLPACPHGLELVREA